MNSIDSQALLALMESQAELRGYRWLRTLVRQSVKSIPARMRDDLTDASSAAVADVLRECQVPTFPTLPESEEALCQERAAELREKGFTRLGRLFTEEQLAEIREHLEPLWVYKGTCANVHPSETAYTLDNVPDDIPQVTYRLDELFHAPHLLEVINKTELLRTCQYYLGVMPTYYMAELYWSFPDRGIILGSRIHRDWENLADLTLYVYIEDTDSTNGPHQYVRGSHRLATCSKAVDAYNEKGGDMDVSELYFDAETEDGPGDEVLEELFGDDIEQIEGPAGTGFLADSRGFHRARALEKGRRGIFRIRIGFYDTGATFHTTPEPLNPAQFPGRIPDHPANRYVLRHLIHSEFTGDVVPPSALPAAKDDPEMNLLSLTDEHGYRAIVRQLIRNAVRQTLEYIAGRPFPRPP